MKDIAVKESKEGTEVREGRKYVCRGMVRKKDSFCLVHPNS